MEVREASSPLQSTYSAIDVPPHFIKRFIYLWLLWVVSAAHRSFPVVVSGGYSLVAVLKLIAVSSLIAEHGL